MIDWFSTQTKVNYSAMTDMFEFSLHKLVAGDQLKKDRVVIRDTKLRLHDTTFEDEIFNPFEATSEGEIYLNALPKDYREEERGAGTSLVWHSIEIDADLQVQKRIRYTVWNLLGDAGGFHDGLTLLVLFLVHPFMATKFQKNIIKKLRKSPDLSEAERRHT